jgi:hypothetical protein
MTAVDLARRGRGRFAAPGGSRVADPDVAAVPFEHHRDYLGPRGSLSHVNCRAPSDTYFHPPRAAP